MRIAIPLAVCLLALIACSGDDDGGGDPISFDQYGPEVAAIFDSSRDELQRLDDEFDEADYETDEELLEADRLLLRSFGAVFSDAARRLGEITPPENAAAAHQTFRDTAIEVAAAFDDYADALDTETVDDASDAVGEALSDFEVACAEVRAIIAANGPSIGIDCVLGEGG